MVGRKNGPKDAKGLIPETYEHSPLYDKRDFVDVIKLNNLRKGKYPVYSG